MPRPSRPQAFHVRKRGSSSDEDSLNVSESTAASVTQRKNKGKGASARSRRKRYRATRSDDDDEEDFDDEEDDDDDEAYTLAADGGGGGGVTQASITQASVPAFLHKLYSMIDEPTTDKHVRWSESGKSFIVEDHEGFAKTILPLYYKHCKFASFVRQLNMYDFHKIPAVQQGALFQNNEHDLWEFSHDHFYRGCNNKLALVTRKRNKNLESSTTRSSLTLAKLVRDIASIRKHQAGITSDLSSLQSDNATLWQESFAAREKHQQHQEVLNKILQFLTTVFTNDDNLLQTTAQQLRGPFMLGKDNEYISLTGQPSSEGGQESITGKSATSLIVEAASLVGMTPSPSTASSETKQLNDDNQTQQQQQQRDEALGRCQSTEAARFQEAVNRTLSSLSYSMLSLFDLPKTTGSSLSSSPSGGGGGSFQGPPTSDITNPFPDAFNQVSCSAETITQDIDDLEADIEALASHIGIDSNHFGEAFDYNEHMDDFRDGYGSMIAGASRSDKIQLFELAGGSHVRNRYDGEGREASSKGKKPASATPNSNDGGDSLYQQQHSFSAIPPPPPQQHHPYSSAASMASRVSSQQHNPATGSIHANLFQSFYHGISMAPPSSGSQPHYVAVPVPIPVPVSLEQYNAAAAGAPIPGSNHQQGGGGTMTHAYYAAAAAAAAQHQQQSVNQALYSPDGPLAAQQPHKGHGTHTNPPPGSDNNQSM